MGFLDRLSAGYLARLLGAVGAVVIVLVGAAPMALAATNPNADPILTEAANGTPNVLSETAPGFTLTDQHGRQVSLHSLAGHTVVLTFLDPVCTSDCPLIAQELRVTDQLLGTTASKVDFVAVADNPLYHSTVVTQAFDRQEGLDHLANWSFLTGSLADLSRVWNSYGIQTDVAVGGAMVAHSDLVYIIDPSGTIREVLDSRSGDDGGQLLVVLLPAGGTDPAVRRSVSRSVTGQRRPWSSSGTRGTPVLVALVLTAAALAACSGPAVSAPPAAPRDAVARPPGRGHGGIRGLGHRGHGAPRRPGSTPSGSSSTSPARPPTGHWPPRRASPPTAAW